ncbi:Inactive RHOMBOID-like protein [Drosera capensis]
MVLELKDRWAGQVSQVMRTLRSQAGYVDFFAKIPPWLCPLLNFTTAWKGEFEQREYDYGTKIALKQKLDGPLQRSISPVLFCFILICCRVMAIRGKSLGGYFSWCKYIHRVPSRSWTCDTNDHSCRATISSGQLTNTA